VTVSPSAPTATFPFYPERLRRKRRARSIPTLELVEVLQTNDRVQLALAKGLLEDSGIPFFVLGQIATLVQDVDPYLHKWVRLQVPQDRETEARQLLESLLEPETISQDVGEEPEP
jgi:hypothetical protein